MKIISTCRPVLLSLAVLSLGASWGSPRVEAVQYKLTTLVSFDGTNGRNPSAGLIADASGNLYGTTSGGGGPGRYGTVFRVDTATHALSTLSSFDGANGSAPLAELIADASGNLYGTTLGGGSHDLGTVFKVDASTHALTTLASFNGANGANPYSSLIADASGTLYGTTTSGGILNGGTLFRLDVDTNTMTTLVLFNYDNGLYPAAHAQLIADGSGNIYGTTFGGGDYGGGTAFQLNVGTHTLTTLASFNSAVGIDPRLGLIDDASGNLYGTAGFGGAYYGSHSGGYGTVFQLNVSTRTLSTLASFDGNNGLRPWGGPIADASGNLYGTTASGGAYNRGTVFRLDASTHALTTLVSFDDANGAAPYSRLITDANGNFYGTTQNGGAYRYGTVFMLSPVPEPATLALSVLGLTALPLVRARRPTAVRHSNEA